MFEHYFTWVVIVLMTVALITEVQKPSLVLIATLVLLHLGGIITIKEAFAGFSNEVMLAAGALFILAYALQSAMAFEVGVEKMLGNKSGKGIYFRLMAPVAFSSGFQPVLVTSLLPVVKVVTQKTIYKV